MSRYPNWTQRQQDLLEAKYGLVSDEVLAKKLGRSVGAIRQRALKTGLRRTSNFLTARDVGRILGVDSKTVANWIRKGRLRGKKSKVVGVGRTWRGGDRSAWHVSWDDFEAFLREQSDFYDPSRIDPNEYTYFRRLAERHAPRNKRHIPKMLRYWTPEEDAILLRYHATMPYPQLTAVLHRSREAIHGRLVLLREKGHHIPYRAPYSFRRSVRDQARAG